MKKRATIVDVAEMAGVSTSTVSFILNQTPGHRFTQETIDRVHEAVQKLQYVRSQSARKLREQRPSSGTICVAYAYVSLRTQLEILGVTEVLQNNGFGVMQMPMHIDLKSGKSKALDQYFADSVEGIICLGLAGTSLGDDWRNTVIERRVPFVSVDTQLDRNISSVEIDYLSGAYALVRKLLQQGVSRIYYVHDHSLLPQTQERMSGIRRALYDAGVDVELIQVVDPLRTSPFLNYSLTEMDYPDSIARMDEALEGLNEGSAVLLDWADHNQFVLQVCRERGLSIPIAALERGALSPVAYPELYYSALPLREMGVSAAESLLRLLKDPTDITHELLAPMLISNETK